MAFAVVMVAVTKCSMGMMPSMLMVLPEHGVTCTGLAAANVKDSVPMLNILPFGMCRSMQNPMVIAATIAAMGSLTPMPCIPMTFDPWSPGAKTVKIAGQAALTNSCKTKCLWGGQIEITMPAQFQTMVS